MEKHSIQMLKTASFDSGQKAVRAVRFSSDGNYCLSCGSDKTVKLWNPYKQLLIKTYDKLHDSEVLGIDSALDNSRIVSSGLDRKVIHSDVGTGQIIRKIRAHVAKVTAVRFNPEATLIFSCSVDTTVKIWDCRSRSYEPVQTLTEAKDTVTSMALSDHEILTGSGDSHIRRYDMRVGQMCVDYLGEPVTSVGFTKDSQCILGGLAGAPLRLLDKDSGELLNEFKGHKTSGDYQLDCCMNSKDTHVLSGSEDGAVYIWDLVEAKLRQKLVHEEGQLPGQPAIVHSLHFHAKKETLVSSAGTNIYLWEG